jgi:hypothetical protein
MAESDVARLRRAFNGEGVDHLSLSTAAAYLPVLMGFFRNRERRQI